ncbi:hypothetical protein Tco_1024745 [Tanacetum coccineum]
MGTWGRGETLGCDKSWGGNPTSTPYKGTVRYVDGFQTRSTSFGIVLLPGDQNPYTETRIPSILRAADQEGNMMMHLLMIEDAVASKKCEPPTNGSNAEIFPNHDVKEQALMSVPQLRKWCLERLILCWEIVRVARWLTLACGVWVESVLEFGFLTVSDIGLAQSCNLGGGVAGVGWELKGWNVLDAVVGERDYLVLNGLLTSVVGLDEFWIAEIGYFDGLLLKGRFRITGKSVGLNRLDVTKIVLLRLKSVPLTSRFVTLEQDELPSSVGLNFRARLDGGWMYLGHLEANPGNESMLYIEILYDVVGTSGYRCEVLRSFPVERIKQGNE